MNSHSIKNVTINAIASAVLALGIVAAVNAASPAQAEIRSDADARMAPETLETSGWTG